MALQSPSSSPKASSSTPIVSFGMQSPSTLLQPQSLQTMESRWSRCDSTIRLAAYRMAEKFEVIRTGLLLDHVRVELVAAVLRSHKRVGFESNSDADSEQNESKECRRLVIDVLTGAAKSRSYVDPMLDLEAVTNAILQLAQRLYGHQVEDEVAVLLVLAATGRIRDKLVFLFRHFCDSQNNSCVSRPALRRLLSHVSRISESLGESLSFGGSALIESSLCQCLSLSPSSRQVDESSFVSWMLREPQMFTWLSTHFRMVMAQGVRHNCRCRGGCNRREIRGLRYQCLICLDFDLCQECFFMGRTAQSHHLSHPLQEYCRRSSRKQSIEAMAKLAFNRFVSSRRRRRRAQRFLTPDQELRGAKGGCLGCKEYNSNTSNNNNNENPNQQQGGGGSKSSGGRGQPQRGVRAQHLDDRSSGFHSSQSSLDVLDALEMVDRHDEKARQYDQLHAEHLRKSPASLETHERGRAHSSDLMLIKRSLDDDNELNHPIIATPKSVVNTQHLRATPALRLETCDNAASSPRHTRSALHLNRVADLMSRLFTPQRGKKTAISPSRYNDDDNDNNKDNATKDNIESEDDLDRRLSSVASSTPNPMHVLRARRGLLGTLSPIQGLRSDSRLTTLTEVSINDLSSMLARTGVDRNYLLSKNISSMLEGRRMHESDVEEVEEALLALDSVFDAFDRQSRRWLRMHGAKMENEISDLVDAINDQLVACVANHGEPKENLSAQH